MSQNEGRIIGRHYSHLPTFYPLPADAVVLDEGVAPAHADGRYRVWALPFPRWKEKRCVVVQVDVEGRCGDVYDEARKPTGVILSEANLDTLRSLLR